MQYDVIVIGAGAVGTASAMEMGRYRLRVLVLEGRRALAPSETNEFLCVGMGPVPGTLAARFIDEGKAQVGAICRRLNVDYEKTGFLLTASDERERAAAEQMLQRGRANGNRNLWMTEGEELRALEPDLPETVTAAVYTPNSARLNGGAMVLAMAENAAANGAEFRFGCPVEKVERAGELWRVTAGGETFETVMVINAAGAGGADLHNAVSSRRIAQPVQPLRAEPLPGSYSCGVFRPLSNVPESEDMILGEADGAEGFMDAFGMGGFGITAAPAIGAFLAENAAYLVSAPENRRYNAERIPFPQDM